MGMLTGRRKVLAMVMAAMMACAVPLAGTGNVVLAAEETAKTSAKLDPYAKVSQSDIQKAFEGYRYQEILRAETGYDEAPRVANAGKLDAGEVSMEGIEDALDAVNLVRRVAGLEPVVENTEFTDKAQHGAALLAHLGQLTASPSQPGNLDDDFYEKAYDGAQRSNLSQQGNLAKAVLEGAADANRSNFSTLGHRRLLLSAALEEVGFGFAERDGKSYAATYLCDDLEDDDEDPFVHDVAWPAENMPLELFDSSQPWSISLGEDYEDPSVSRVKVTLQKRGEKRIWKFDQNSANFAVSNRGLGQGKTLIFWPVNAKYEAGDIFDVKIEGLRGKAKTLEYSVTFFNAVDENKKPSSSNNKKDPVEKYQAIFRINGATGETPSATVSNKNKVSMPKADELQKPGSIFAGWRSSSDGKVYQAGQAVVLTEHTTFTAQWKPDPSRNLELDTKEVTVAVNGTYQFLVRGNNDVENMKVAAGNAAVASVVLVEASDPRGAAYQVRGNAAGTTDIKVTYRGQSVNMRVRVDARVQPGTSAGTRGSITLDTAQYSMAPGNRYTIGNVIRDASGNTLTGAQVQNLVRSGKLRVRDSRTGSVATLEALPDGNFRVTGKTPGTCYIVYEIGGTHASVRIDVQNGVQQHGSAVRNTSYFTQPI